MNWTTLTTDWAANNSEFDNNIWTEGTIFKEKFPDKRLINADKRYVGTTHTVYYQYNGYGLMDTFLGSPEFVPRGAALSYAEYQDNKVKAVFFRDDSVRTHYFTNLWYTGSNQTIHIHGGTDTSDVIYLKAGNTEESGSINLLTQIEAEIANNAYGSSIYLQPLVIYGIPTTVYKVFGSATLLAPFTEFSIGNKNFLVIAKGLCIEVISSPNRSLSLMKSEEKKEELESIEEKNEEPIEEEPIKDDMR